MLKLKYLMNLMLNNFQVNKDINLINLKIGNKKIE